jgi:hypothetical protein
MIVGRIVEVILVEDGVDRTYFTTEGVEIGSFKSGKRATPVIYDETEKPRSGVIMSPTPKQVKVAKDREIEDNMTLEKRLAHVKDSI